MMKGSFTPAGKRRWECKTHRSPGVVDFCYTTTDPKAPYRDQKSATKRSEERARFKRKLQAKIYVITAAQNATPIHAPFFSSLRTYCEARGAELVVIPLRYKNPTSKWTESQQNAEWWMPELAPYLFNQRKKLNDNLTLLGDLKIQPTAVHPLTGLEGLTHGESSIIGHTKVAMKAVPTPQNSLPKLMTTTGAVTVPNFTDTRAGKQGEFHHTLGAVVIEIESRSVFHMRHINARKDGAFIDLDKAYFPDRVEQAPPYEAIVFGDAHYRFADPKVVEGTFGEGGLVELLNPKALVWHDLLDAYAVSPHHVGNPFIAKAKKDAGFDNIRREVVETVEWMAKLSSGRKSYIVSSNHDNMLARWIVREDWRDDPENAEFYLETALHMARSAKMGPGGAQHLDPFQYWVQKLAPGSAHCLSRSESLEIMGIECSLHGDKGPHGARGSIKNLSRLGVKVVSGHGHTPAVEEGHWRTGTMTFLGLEYNDGPSAWMNTHCSIDAFGKRHLHNLIGGKFRT